MKTYKRTRIIASLAILSSLTINGVAFAATDIQPISRNSSSNASISRPLNTRRSSTNSSGSRMGNKSSATSTGEQANSNRPYFGTVTSLTDTGFIIQKHNIVPRNSKLASTTPVTIIVGSSTVYMKSGKLDSSAEVTVGNSVVITGTLDASTNTLNALGVNIITKPSSALIHGKIRSFKKLTKTS